MHSLSDSDLLFQRSTILKLHCFESLLFPLTLSLTLRLTFYGADPNSITLNLNLNVSTVVHICTVDFRNSGFSELWIFGIAGRYPLSYLLVYHCFGCKKM